MKTHRSAAALAILLMLLIQGCDNTQPSAPAAQPSPQPVPQIPAGAYTLSGPYTHRNLTIFLFHGADKIKGKSYLTLQEAMDQKKVIVHETGEVNELAIENISKTDEVYVQSGDIVKGGKQDRVIALDFIVPAQSGKMPINSFCVEQGRWRGRGSENVAAFSSSTQQAASKEVKLAAKHAGQQGEVWQKVAESQAKLQQNLKAEVKAAESQSSLQLTLENSKVQESADDYVKKLENIIKEKPDTIGYAFAINGEVNSADVYASHELFVKLWPKLLKSSAIEAVAEFQDGRKTEPAKAAAVHAVLEDVEKGKKSEKSVSARVKMDTYETKDNVRFRTYDGGRDNVIVHENLVKK